MVPDTLLSWDSSRRPGESGPEHKNSDTERSGGF
jgi:hypothetical protein